MSKSTNNKPLFIALIVFGVIANLLLIEFFRQRAADKFNAKEEKVAYERLEKYFSLLSVERIFAKFSRDLFEQVKGKKIDSAISISNRLCSELGIDPKAIEVIFFADGKPLNALPGDRESWEMIMNRFDRSLDNTIRSTWPVRAKAIRFLNGGIGFSRLEGKPGKLIRFSLAKTRSYAIWYADRKAENTDGLIFMIHAKYFASHVMARILSKHLKSGFYSVWYLDAKNLKDAYLPDWLSPNKVLKEVQGSVTGKVQKTLSINGRKLALLARPDGKILIAEMPQESFPLPVWCFATFIWLPLVTKKLFMDSDYQGINLRLLLYLVTFFGLVLPISIAIFFWKSFLDVQREKIKIDLSKKLQSTLIELDTSFSQNIREKTDKFKKIVNKIKGKPEKLQEFIDTTVNLELQGEYDTCALLDDQGNYVRPYSGSTYVVRRLVFYSKKYKRNAIDLMYLKGWVPFDDESQYVLNNSSETLNIKDFVSFRPIQSVKSFQQIGKVAGPQLINYYNRLHGKTPMGKKQKLSSMVVGSVLEGDEDNPVNALTRNIGEMSFLGIGENISLNYVDVITNSDGSGKYGVIFFSSFPLVIDNFLFKVFDNKQNWPEKIDFYALSDRTFRLNFPYLDTWLRMQGVMDQLSPPRTIYSSEIKISGKKYLMAAYSTRKVLDYKFVATIPMTEVENRLYAVKRNALIGIIAFLLLIIFFSHNLYVQILGPSKAIMKGIKAMADKNHEHRINISTGDEWEDISRTFNNSLEVMKDLEIATFVQNCILPTGKTTNGKCTFSGRTVSADEVGGDYYDVFLRESGEMIFLMGDVSGHSISAALVVSMAKAAFGALVDSGLYLPQDIFARMNTLMLSHLNRVKMMTCFAGYIDNDGNLTFSNSGHPFPMLLTKSGVKSLKQIGYPLGAAKKKKFKFEELPLTEKSRIVMFGDGFIEATNEAGELFGYERFEELVTSLGIDCPIDDFYDKVYQGLKEFSKDVPWGDDVTMAILDYDPKS
jgi:serine phosphatase RsbU (regulator of sigma subunit)